MHNKEKCSVYIFALHDAVNKTESIAFLTKVVISRICWNSVFSNPETYFLLDLC